MKSFITKEGTRHNFSKHKHRDEINSHKQKLSIPSYVHWVCSFHKIRLNSAVSRHTIEVALN